MLEKKLKIEQEKRKIAEEKLKNAASKSRTYTEIFKFFFGKGTQNIIEGLTASHFHISYFIFKKKKKKKKESSLLLPNLSENLVRRLWKESINILGGFGNLQKKSREELFHEKASLFFGHLQKKRMNGELGEQADFQITDRRHLISEDNSSRIPDISFFPPRVAISWTHILFPIEIEKFDKEKAGTGQAVEYAQRALEADESRNLAFGIYTNLSEIVIVQKKRASNNAIITKKTRVLDLFGRKKQWLTAENPPTDGFIQLLRLFSATLEQLGVEIDFPNLFIQRKSCEIIKFLGNSPNCRVYAIRYKNQICCAKQMIVKDKNFKQLQNEKKILNLLGKVNHSKNFPEFKYLSSSILITSPAGVPLESWFWKRGGQIRKISVVFKIILKLLKDLHLAHEEGIVHADVRPSNIIMLGEESEKESEGEESEEESEGEESEGEPEGEESEEEESGEESEGEQFEKVTPMLIDWGIAFDKGAKIDSYVGTVKWAADSILKNPIRFLESHDFESLAYVAFYLLHGRLLWHKTDSKDEVLKKRKKLFKEYKNGKFYYIIIF